MALLSFIPNQKLPQPRFQRFDIRLLTVGPLRSPVVFDLVGGSFPYFEPTRQQQIWVFLQHGP